ncbi:hypothetical protein ATE49_15450 [Elizabethkingia miricola]|uniref:Uncharacterized protein n=1 Tax=Elizabethkingia miricola TaxID=172045 RepID=A0ABY3NBF6_ELIMR|nr:hypothetical protein [Elizabethkingia miricola]OBS12792.1 hypothetical protein ATE49_15450 [Elizabethkingia miricola]TYO83950.1 hypothetical protein LX74_04041 [Elizabethkingia miricola]
METPKEQAIKAAYGEFWERLSPFQQEYALSENGTVEIGYTEEQKKLFSDIRKSGLFNVKPTMPKSLSGIGTNNGWTRIESEEDLPGNINSLWIKYSDGSIVLGHYNIFQKKFETVYGKCFDGDTATHYQPIETPKPPIF